MGHQSRLKSLRRAHRSSPLTHLLDASVSTFNMTRRNIHRSARIANPATAFVVRDERPMAKRIDTRGFPDARGRGPVSMAHEGAAAKRLRLDTEARVRLAAKASGL